MAAVGLRLNLVSSSRTSILQLKGTKSVNKCYSNERFWSGLYSNDLEVCVSRHLHSFVALYENEFIGSWKQYQFKEQRRVGSHLCSIIQSHQQYTLQHTGFSTVLPCFLSRNPWPTWCDVFYFPKFWSNNQNERNSVHLHWRIVNELLQLYCTTCKFTSRYSLKDQYERCLLWVLYDEKGLFNKFRTSNYNDSVTAGCEVIVREYLGGLNQLQHPITREIHKTRTNPDSMPSNRPK